MFYFVLSAWFEQMQPALSSFFSWEGRGVGGSEGHFLHVQVKEWECRVILFLCCFGSESHPYVQAVTELTELWVERARYVFSDTPQTLHAQTNRQADRLTCARMYVIQWQIYSSVILLALTLDSVPTTIDVSSVSVSPCHTCDVCQALLSPFVGSKIGVVWEARLSFIPAPFCSNRNWLCLFLSLCCFRW